MKFDFLKKTQPYHVLLWGLFLIAGLQAASSFTGTSKLPPPSTSQDVIDLPIMTAQTSATQSKKGPLAFSPAGIDVLGQTELKNAVKITSGTPAKGKVLVSDGLGNARWAELGIASSTGACRRVTGVMGSLSDNPVRTYAKNNQYFNYRYKTGIAGYSVSEKVGASGVWTEAEYPRSKYRTVTVSPGACVYTMLFGGSGKVNVAYCEGMDERIGYWDVGDGDSHTCASNWAINGANAYEGGNNNGGPGCYVLCKERAFNYVPKPASDCVPSGTVGLGNYTAVPGTGTNASISSGPITTCEMKYYPAWTCPANTATYTYANPNVTTGKCTRTTIKTGVTAQVAVVKPSYTMSCNTDAGWIKYRETHRESGNGAVCIGGNL